MCLLPEMTWVLLCCLGVWTLLHCLTRSHTADGYKFTGACLVKPCGVGKHTPSLAKDCSCFKWVDPTPRTHSQTRRDTLDALVLPNKVLVLGSAEATPAWRTSWSRTRAANNTRYRVHVWHSFLELLLESKYFLRTAGGIVILTIVAQPYPATLTISSIDVGAAASSLTWTSSLSDRTSTWPSCASLSQIFQSSVT